MVSVQKTLKKYWPIFIISILGLFVSWPLFRSGYFSHQDDLQIIRIFEMRKCFSDLQIPCRWVPDMGWGNGMPLFNFYGVAAYYAGGLLSYFVGYIISAKILFFAALTFGSFGVYFLIRDLWGKYAGLTSAILYMYAPYKALDIYVRGALSESVALALIPFVLFFAYKKNYKLFALTLFLFLITHNIMTVIFVPIILLWMFYWQVTEKFKDLKLILLSLVLAFGMSAFFTFPAFLEKDLVQTESLTRFELDYRANYISVKKLFLDRVWGYGTSIPGPNGGMNFSIGWPHWILAFTSLFVLFMKKIDKKIKYLVSSIFLVFIMSALMTHNKSSFVWEHIKILTFFQFPWRFLSLSILTASILGGVFVSFFKEKLQIYVAFVLIIIIFLLNWGYFRPHEFYKITDTEKLSGQLWDDQRRGAILDYLPKTALEPREAASKLNNFINRSNKFTLNVNVHYETQIEIPIFYFPNWKVTIDGIKTEVTHDNILGRISVKVPIGQHKIVGNFKNTPLRTFANILSIFSFMGLLIWTKYKK